MPSCRTWSTSRWTCWWWGRGGGRLVGHTALFALALWALSRALARGGRRRGAELAGILAFGSGVHILLDRVFLDPRVLLWPLLGAAFPAGEIGFADWWRLLLTDP